MRIMRTTAKLAACAAAAATLSGCVAVELAHLVYVAANQNIGYSADARIHPQDGKYVYFETFHTDNVYGDICVADGVVVDYSAKTDTSSPVAQAKFDPANIYGQAVILYKEQCGDGIEVSDRDVVKTGSRRQVFGEPLKMQYREKIVFHDYFENNGAHRPDWMPQVLDTIQAQAAAGDKDANRFLAFVGIEDGEPTLANMPAKAVAKLDGKKPE